MTRASLMNLAVYGEERDSLEQNTQLMARITEDHACRAIVIEADCSSKDDRVDAWIKCALSRESRREQASLLRTNFIPPQRRLYHFAPEHSFLAPRFRPAVLPLVAGGIPRTDGPATLGVGR